MPKLCPNHIQIKPKKGFWRHIFLSPLRQECNKLRSFKNKQAAYKWKAFAVSDIFTFTYLAFVEKQDFLIRFLLKPQKMIDLRLALPMQRGLISNQAWKLQIRVVTPQQNIYESCFWIKRQAGFCTRGRVCTSISGFKSR